MPDSGSFRWGVTITPSYFPKDSNTYFETFEFLLKFAKSSFRRKPESSNFRMFWTPAFAGVTGKCRFSKVSL